MSDLPDPDRSIITTRLISGPQALVYQMFTDPAHVGNWWGPDGFTTTSHSHDLRVGGAWRFTMHGPDGSDDRNRILFTEITPTRIACLHDGDDGGDPAQSFSAAITIKAVGDQTRVTLHLFCATLEQRAAMAQYGAVEGGKQTLAQLDT